MGDDVAASVTNGGGIRASIAEGDISMLDMKTVFPFGNEVSVLSVTGAELMEALEAATYTTPDAIGAFPQVAGIEFTVDTAVPYEAREQYPDSTYFAPLKPGSRVTIASVGGKPFDAGRCTRSPPTTSPPRAATPTTSSATPTPPAESDRRGAGGCAGQLRGPRSLKAWCPRRPTPAARADHRQVARQTI